jgi:prepilin-type N-terminal cleavage/methylation domain-containing protein
MKLQVPFPGSRRNGSTTPDGGFTLTEVLIASTVFLLLVSGVVFANLFGLSMFRITQTKLNASSGARKTIARMANEIRTCKTTWVGNVTNGVFHARLDGETQQGSGLLIYPTTNAANYIVYFVNPSDKTFRRTTSTPGSATVVTGTITNTVVFRAQDYLGSVLTNNQNNRVIHLDLEFQQPKRHRQIAGHYKLETSVTRRALE